MQYNRIREERERQGLSLVELSRKIGIGAQTISSWEKGHHVPLKHIPVLAQVFHVAEDDIVWEESTILLAKDMLENSFANEKAISLRPQLDCCCGNCNYWKQRYGMLYRCSCISSDAYGYATGKSYLCIFWESPSERYLHVLSRLPEEDAIAQNLVLLRELEGKSISEVSNSTSIREGELINYEKGLSPMTIDVLKTLADYYKVTPDELIIK